MTEKIDEKQAFAQESIEFKIHKYFEPFGLRFIQFRPTEIESQTWNGKVTSAEFMLTFSRTGELLAWTLNSSGDAAIDSAVTSMFKRATADPFPEPPAGSPKEIQLRVFYSHSTWSGLTSNLSFPKNDYAREYVAPVLTQTIRNSETEGLFEKLSPSSDAPQIGLVISKSGKLQKSVVLRKSKSAKLNEHLIKKTSPLIFAPLPEEFPDPVHIIAEMRPSLRVQIINADLSAMALWNQELGNP